MSLSRLLGREEAIAFLVVVLVVVLMLMLLLGRLFSVVTPW